MNTHVLASDDDKLYNSRENEMTTLERAELTYDEALANVAIAREALLRETIAAAQKASEK